MSPNTRRINTPGNMVRMVRGRSLMVLSALLFSATLVSAISPAAYGASPTPQALQVTVDNGVASVTAGDTLTYIITVQNQSNAVANGLLLTQNIPVDLEYVLADPGGTATSGSVSWDLELGPNATKTFRTVMTVLTAPTELDRVASMVCVATAVGVRPQVCATDTDQLSGAGGAAGTGEAPAASPIPWWPIVATLAVLTVLTVTALTLFRRRRSSASS